jgi:glc operon protein GlcG
VTLDIARKAVEAALAAAQQHNLQMAVVVVDPAGNLVTFARIDGTQTASLQLAIDKARSAAMYRRSTKVFEEALVGGRHAILALTGAMPVEGGVPLLAENRIVGAIGVSGGTSQEDGQIAAAGVAATH